MSSIKLQSPCVSHKYQKSNSQLLYNSAAISKIHPRYSYRNHSTFFSTPKAKSRSQISTMLQQSTKQKRDELTLDYIKNNESTELTDLMLQNEGLQKQIKQKQTLNKNLKLEIDIKKQQFDLSLNFYKRKIKYLKKEYQTNMSKLDQIETLLQNLPGEPTNRFRNLSKPKQKPRLM